LGVSFTADHARPLLIELERRNAHGLSGGEAVLRLRALAVHPQLAFANDALGVREREAPEARLEKPINGHAGLVGRGRDRLRGGGSSRRQRPCPVILRRPPRAALEGGSAAALRGSLCVGLWMTARRVATAAIMITRSGDLPPAARLPGPTTA